MSRILLGLCVAAFGGLFAAMMLALVRRRADAAGPPTFHSHAAAEYLWAVVPWLMIIACALPAARRILAGH